MSEQNDKLNGSEGTQYRILIVDDEAPVVRSLQRALRKEPYEIFIAGNGAEALEQLSQHHIHMVLTDFRMPDMNGVELVEKIKEKYPDVIRIVLSGYSESWAVIDAVNRGCIYKFLTKPWDDEALKVTLKRALESFELAKKNRTLNESLQELNRQLQDVNATLENKVQERTRELNLAREKLEQMLNGTVQVMSILMDANNADLAGHGRRTALYSRKLAEELGLQVNLDELEKAAFLHDVGKIYVPDGNKTDHINSPQRPVRNHSDEGYKLLVQIPGFERIATIVRHHHEAYDGSGYPDRLKGENIPVESRVVTVADSFDRIIFAHKNDCRLTREVLEEQARKLASSKLDPHFARVFVEKIYPRLPDLCGVFELPIDRLVSGMIPQENIYGLEQQLLGAAMTPLEQEQIAALTDYSKNNHYAPRIKIKLGALPAIEL